MDTSGYVPFSKVSDRILEPERAEDIALRVMKDDPKHYVAQGKAFYDRVLAEAVDMSKIRFLLDVACGMGGLPYTAVQKNGKCLAIGIDKSEKTIRLAKDENNKPVIEGAVTYSKLNDRLELRVMSVYDMPYHNDFDVVTCVSSLHQFEDPERAIQKMIEAVKVGGTVHIRDLMRDAYKKVIVGLERGDGLEKYKSDPSAYEMHKLKSQLLAHSLKASLSKEEYTALENKFSRHNNKMDFWWESTGGRWIPRVGWTIVKSD